MSNIQIFNTDFNISKYNINDLDYFVGEDFDNLKTLAKCFVNVNFDYKIDDEGEYICIETTSKDVQNDIICLLHEMATVAKENRNVTEQIILGILNSLKKPKQSIGLNILKSIDRKQVKTKNVSQTQLVKAIEKNDMVFAIGAAGTGKTFISVAMAVKALKNKEIKKIIFTRPAVEAGESLGFLPGDLKEKLDPYMQPIYDSLSKFYKKESLDKMIEDRVIEISPLAFMRGRTLDDAYVILDEAQNTTVNQMRMFLTRMGLNSKYIITGDQHQIDLPKKIKSGLVDAIARFGKINGIAKVEFHESDVVRHKLVKLILEEYKKEI